MVYSHLTTVPVTLDSMTTNLHIFEYSNVFLIYLENVLIFSTVNESCGEDLKACFVFT